MAALCTNESINFYDTLYKYFSNFTELCTEGDYFTQNSKHGPIGHGIIAKIFVIVMNYVPMCKMLYISHDFF